MSGTGTTTGKLYGVGLGPGDPNLMTVAAVKAIAAADVIAYHSARHGRSIARSIAAEHLRADHIEERLMYPLTVETTDHPGGYRGALNDFYEEASARLAAHLDAGRTVAVLAEGDPLFYGSYQHMHKRLAHRYDTTVIPGVTSVSAAAARLGEPLCEAEEVLTIIPGTLPEDELTARLAGTDSAVVMKLGRTFPTVKRALEQAVARRRPVRGARVHGGRADRRPRGRRPGVRPVLLRRRAALPYRPGTRRTGAGRGRRRRHRTGRRALAHPRVARRARQRRRPRRLHHLPGPGAGAPPRADPARLGQQSGVRAGRVRPRPGPARPPRRRRLGRRPGRLRDGHGRPGGRLRAAVRGRARTGPPRGDRRQRGRRRRGRPLGHDYATISLSDRLKPWDVIEARLRAATAADLVLALYNPGSKSRTHQVAAARDLLLELRSPETPVVVARDVGGPEQSVRVVTLKTLEPSEVDMRTLLLVGSSQTRAVERADGRTITWTPRRYG